MQRASSSIERPCSAARTRSWVFSRSSMFRIVMLAIGAVPTGVDRNCII
jgi:hypothetical protein